MHFQCLDKYKSKDPSFAVLIPQLVNYFQEFYLKSVHNKKDLDRLFKIGLLPGNLASKLNIEESMALTLLDFAEREDLVKRAWEVYCYKKRASINEYDNFLSIPRKVHCHYHNKKHGQDNYYLDVIYHFTRKAWDEYNVPFVFCA